MRRKNKGKIHPSPSSSPAPSPSPASGSGDDVFSVLNVLPSAILALALVLPLEDREVLAYMITRSVEVSTAATDPASLANTRPGRKKAFKKPGGGGSAAHRPPLFHCHCFDCYTAYWLRWDSSASRELIHQAIEAFEDHLDLAERPARGGNLRREKSSHPGSVRGRPETPVQESPPFAEGKDRASLTEMNDHEEEEEEEEEDDVVVVELSEELQLEQAEAEARKEKDGVAEVMEAAVTVLGGDGGGRRGLVSKLLPNVAGLLNFRRWKLWNPSE